MQQSEIQHKADFSTIRYAQVWEDADVLLAGLAINPGDSCLSIASAGDNTLALLATNPAKVVALDLNPAQLYCLELRVAAYRTLTHPQLLALIGSRPAMDRGALYHQCRSLLSTAARNFWDRQTPAINRYGIGGIGKFEHYFRLFRDWMLPLVHSKSEVAELLRPHSAAERRTFFDRQWNNRRWRWLVRIFFSENVMGRIGRDPAFFHYVEGDVATHIAQKIQHGLCTLDPASNPYLHWILTGTHGEALPFALRPENFEPIRRNLDRLEWHLLSLESYIEQCKGQGERIDRFNLSDIFEYMSPENYSRLLAQLVEVSRRGARLLYWNMMVPRSCPQPLQDRLQPLRQLANSLHAQDKAIFYRSLQIEEVR